MQVDGAPSTIFAIQQLLRALQLIVVVLSRASVCATPVLDDVPIGTLTTITRSNEALITTGGVKRADNIAALFCKVLGQDTLVLQSPKDNRGRIATLLNPSH